MIVLDAAGLQTDASEYWQQDCGDRLTAAEPLVALVLLIWAWRGCRCRVPGQKERERGRGAAHVRKPHGRGHAADADTDAEVTSAEEILQRLAGYCAAINEK